VDDEEVVRYLGKELLEYLGYHVFLAEDGRQGLDIYMSHRGSIDLVLLDISMPQLSGYEVLNRIRAVDPHARVIISSGYAMDKTAESGVLSAASGYLMKPYVLADMARTIRQVLDLPADADQLHPGMSDH
jgi:CheY-like chemotaxis protein